MIKIANYSSLVFDCDGVLLNSNQVKTKAFYQATLPYGQAAAQAMVEYHVANGGISRYKKFHYFLQQLVPRFAPEVKGPNLEQLLDTYAQQVRQGLLTCEVADGLEELRAQTSEARWLVVSGGDQSELREIFALRELADMFDGGIFGSPDTKDQILACELKSGNIKKPALFLGDSRYDYLAARRVALDFLFLYRWTEVCDWSTWVEREKVIYTSDIRSISSSINNQVNLDIISEVKNEQ